MNKLTRCLPIIVSICAVLGVIPTTQAKDWLPAKPLCSGTVFWDRAECWSPSGQPVSGEDAIVTQDGPSDIVITYRNTLDPPHDLGQHILDGTGTGTVRLEQQTLNSFLSASVLFVGQSGSGEYLQTEGTSIFDYAILAGQPDSSGQFDLGGSGAATFGSLGIGVYGTGTFVQTGGTNTVGTDTITGLMQVGVEAGSSGSYTLAGGTLTVGDFDTRTGIEEIGRWGTGSFTQEAGTLHNVFGTLFISRKAGPLDAPVPATGTYTMNGGTLNADDLELGSIARVVNNKDNVYPNVHEASDGRFIHNGGDVTVTNDLVISSPGGARGLYELRGGNLTANNVLNNDRFEYSGGSLDSGIENHALLTFSGALIRTVTGNVTNVGQTTYTVYNSLDPPVLIYEETKNGVVSLADGTRVSIDMDLTLEELGTLDIELGSSFFGFEDTTPWISIGGQARIGGILDLTDISGWVPVSGDSWTILAANTVSGLFDSVLLPVLPDWNWELVYGADKIILTGLVPQVPVPAAVWLFGSGLLGLVATARRRKS